MIEWTVTKPEMDEKTGWSDFRVYRAPTRSYWIHRLDGDKDSWRLEIFRRNKDGGDILLIYEQWYMSLDEVESQITRIEEFKQ